MSKLEFQAPKARNVKAQGTALGERALISLRALKARNRNFLAETKRIKAPSTSFRAFGARELGRLVPGPMAQAIAFRAFGAWKSGFVTDSLRPGKAQRGCLRRVATPEIKGFNRRYATKTGTNLIPALKRRAKFIRRYASKALGQSLLQSVIPGRLSPTKQFVVEIGLAQLGLKLSKATN